MSDGSATAVSIAWAPVTVPCPVPVTPNGGTDAPMSERTGTCRAHADWWMGAQPACEAHMRHACDLLGIDFDDVRKEAQHGRA